MTVALEGLRIVLLAGGLFFFVTGSLGLLRFPDTYTRLHAVTKADNVGLGLLVAGLSLHSLEWQSTALMLLIWLFVMASGATSAQLLARYQREQDRQESASNGNR
ncbi:MAG: monovalent cation/H(+) antiporter subunit G [Pseudohongiellaceae bacterium]